ncbi:hypothetical protein CE557_112 [Cardinium endosymbiont of Sogatella furcifera]|uniref:DUF4296 domain-containing protein n=1 Tax=Cardinium endosymbiont of Sogatella furcifera TaxID=650378 RepID=UPI000E0CF169|nr:DUF4296 domain-containing protein [Cardinium endosymbiont of Sogatella furcifera]AXI23954.1 hypothetical protein CE557_112 [Cardinium endosymbiont of Sogatella furcifera]
MKKIATILLALSLLYWISRSSFTTTHHPPTTIINETVFVHIVRDLELLDSWLYYSYYTPETIELLRHQNHQKILALYKVEPEAFQASIRYYLEEVRAMKIYEKVYLALEALSS